MKKIVFVLALGAGLMASNAVDAQQRREPQTAAAAVGSAPVFKFEGGDVHDFGTLKEGDAATYTFVFKNTGKTPLIIQGASASCGCTTPVYSKEPVLPGKKGKITVSYDTKNRVGPIDKTVYIQSNAALPDAMKPGGRYELKIKGTVVARAAS